MVSFPYYSHTRDSYGSGGNSIGPSIGKGSHYGGSLKIPLNSLGMVQGSLLSIAWFFSDKQSSPGIMNQRCKKPQESTMVMV